MCEELRFRGCLRFYDEAVHGKKIPNFDSYSLDRDGNVWSFRQHPRTPKKLKPGLGKNGYLLCILCKEGKTIPRTIHSLMAEVYIGPRPEGCDVRHLDCNKTNNSLDNLEYGSRGQNNIDSSLRGKRNITKEQAIEIYRLACEGNLKQREIAEMFNTTKTVVCLIKGKRSWKHIHE